MGSIYKRGTVYWIKYYKNGQGYRESSGTDKKMVARQLLEIREGEIAQGKSPSVIFDRVSFKELSDDFIRDYRINQKKSLVRAERSVKHLTACFGGMKATQITTPRINTYVESRLDEGAANASINRELSALKRMFHLAARQTPPRVDRVPYIAMLKENNVRKGFLEHAEFVALRDALPDYLKGVATFAYKVGWRSSEIINLTWKQVDLNQGIVTLDVGETKNDEARTVYLDDELIGIFKAQWELRKDKQSIIPSVFPNRDGNDQIKDFRGAWSTACRNAGIGKKLFHDLRRTAVRNMVRAGIPERVAMMVSGHKTRSVFDRYNIVSDADLKSAAHKQDAYLKSNEVSAMGTILGTVTKLRQKKGANLEG
ncbi:MAG: tyrosine-type recombinase/integrase [Deltaproteobacteria bacterium]|nr:tyrosine-type recombinase/integrase [Deltaproteobacteria bacterium]